MSNIGEELKPESWIIIVERRDGSAATKSVHAVGETLAEAAEAAEAALSGSWTVVAGRVLR